MNLSNSTNQVVVPIQSPLWYWIMSLLVAIVTVVGNGIVIYLITTRRCLHITNNYFIFSLVIADISTGIFVIPLTYICEQLQTCNNDRAHIIVDTIFFASVANICSMTLDRYISIVIPLKYFAYMTRKRVVITICLSWLIPFIAAVIPQTYIYSGTEIKVKASRIYDPIQMLVFVILPIMLMLIVYLRIYIIARKISRQNKQTHNQLRYNDSNGNDSPEQNKKERRETHNREGSVAVLGAVIIIFAFCWVLSVYNAFCFLFNICAFVYESHKTAQLLLHLNSSINPIVYAVLKKDIRRELRRLLHGRRRSSFDRNASSYSFATSTKLESSIK